jgi:hypothetical protein
MMNHKRISVMAILASVAYAPQVVASGKGDTLLPPLEDSSSLKSPQITSKPSTEEKVEDKFVKETGKVAEQVTGATIGIKEGLKKLGKHKKHNHNS